MIFHEIYGCYYKSITEMLKLALNNELDNNTAKKIIDRYAFNESSLEILPALLGQKWQLIDRDFSTPIINSPSLPLTTLEKRWLKAISLDKRIALFDIDFSFLGDTEPLFLPESIKYFDKSLNSDPFDDPLYISHFKTVLEAVKNKKTIMITYTNRRSITKSFRCSPYKIEYSEKDDKFRVYASSCRRTRLLNLASIDKCTIDSNAHLTDTDTMQDLPMYVVFELSDQRNALERVLLHFANFEKEAEALGDDRYKVRLYYDKNDEAEMVIRILSFGQHIKVTQPDSFVQLIRNKLKMQYEFSKEKRKMFDE